MLKSSEDSRGGTMQKIWFTKFIKKMKKVTKLNRAGGGGPNEHKEQSCILYNTLK